MGRGKTKKLEAAQSRMKLSLMEFVSNRYYTAPEGLLPNNEYSYPGTPHTTHTFFFFCFFFFFCWSRQSLTVGRGPVRNQWTCGRSVV